MPRGHAVAVTVVAFALSPAAAVASTVKVVIEPPRKGSSGSVEFQAAAGESNRVELFKVDDTTVRVIDQGATIRPGVGCSAVDAYTVLCSTGVLGSQPLINSVVRSGDLNDTINGHDVGLTANGGPGDDRIESAASVAGTLNGGGGRDVLLGGTDTDTLVDGDRSGAADSDVLDGRKGGAIVSYQNRTAPVFVNLATLAPAGERGEGDVLRAIGGAVGGAANDVLRGDDAPNRLSGGLGDDHLYGLGRRDGLDGDAGNDRLSGGTGRDFLNGGPDADVLLGSGGDDTLWGRSGTDLLRGGTGDDWLEGGRDADVLTGSSGGDELSGGWGADLLRGGTGGDRFDGGEARCGRGSDRVTPSAERDRVGRDCESLLFFLRHGRFDSRLIYMDPRPDVSAGALTFMARCPYGDDDDSITPLPITGTVSLKAGRRLIARAPILPEPAGACTADDFPLESPEIRIPVALNATGRKLLADRRPTQVTVRFRGRNVPDHPFTITLP